MPAETQSERQGRPVFSLLLMAGLGMAFVLQLVLIVPKTYSAYLFLSGYGMKSAHLWELLTYQFFHSTHSLAAGLAHLAFNLAGLWFVGRGIEKALGGARFLIVYQGAVLLGGLAQGGAALAGFFLPESMEAASTFLITRFGDAVGGSVGLCGVWAAWCVWKQRWDVFWVSVVAAAALVAWPGDPSLAHLAHLTALLAGTVLFRIVSKTAVSGPA
jgi:membrane associated rhomboid family serine protease